MESLFHKDPTLRPPPSPYEQIAPEIEHLKKKTSIRSGKAGDKATLGRFCVLTAIATLLALYFMDPFLYAIHKGDAIRAYLYLHNYRGGNEPTVDALLASRI